jgi:hypothetical protein
VLLQVRCAQAAVTLIFHTTCMQLCVLSDSVSIYPDYGVDMGYDTMLL